MHALMVGAVCAPLWFSGSAQSEHSQIPGAEGVGMVGTLYSGGARPGQAEKAAPPPVAEKEDEVRAHRIGRAGGDLVLYFRVRPSFPLEGAVAGSHNPPYIFEFNARSFAALGWKLAPTGRVDERGPEVELRIPAEWEVRWGRETGAVLRSLYLKAGADQET